jgi:predicted tellurium resistance membrane protein TerC
LTFLEIVLGIDNVIFISILAGKLPPHQQGKARGDLFGTVLQIALLDIVFSLDSVITAVGMAKEIGVMITAVTIAVLVMVLAAAPISRVVDRHPTIKMLGLAFLILIGVVLVADGVGPAHRTRLYLFCHGVLHDRRDAQYPAPFQE